MPTTATPPNEIRVHIRWMIRRDMPEVLDIEHDGFEFPWTEKEFVAFLKRWNCIGMVAEHEDRVVGFMAYSLYKYRCKLCNLAVAADCRGRGVGRQMVAKMQGKLTPSRRRFLDVMVRESNLPALLFFKHHGFQAGSVVHQPYEEIAEDGYAMRYQLNPKSLPPPFHKET